MKFNVICLALAGAMLLSGPASAQAPIVVKLSPVAANDRPGGEGRDRFRDLAGTAANGHIKLEVYLNSTRYKDKEETEAL